MIKCYYCEKSAVQIKTYIDDIEGIDYPFAHCIEHIDIDDFSQDALDLWKQSSGFMENTPR